MKTEIIFLCQILVGSLYFVDRILKWILNILIF